MSSLSEREESRDVDLLVLDEFVDSSSGFILLLLKTGFLLVVFSFFALILGLDLDLVLFEEEIDFFISSVCVNVSLILFKLVFFEKF
jgi:hypothetical protein